MDKGYTGKIDGCDGTKSNADLFSRRVLGKGFQDAAFPFQIHKPRVLCHADLGYIWSSNPSTKRAGGEREVALKACINTLVPRATSELFTLITPQHQCSFPVQPRPYLLIFKSPLG